MYDHRLHRQFDLWFRRQENSSLWLEGSFARVYVRRGPRTLLALPGQECITIANALVKQECQGRFVFTNFLAFVETFGLSVYLESVLNPQLAAHFDKDKRYVKIDHGGVVNFFMVQKNVVRR